MKTYKEWRAAGYQVIHGQKTKRRNTKGEAVFSKKQVKSMNPVQDADYDMYMDDYNQWYDGYGHTRDWV